MAPPPQTPGTTRPSLSQFLSQARADLQSLGSRAPPPVTFVVGNESADLDSVCSALVLAYFQSYRGQPPPAAAASQQRPRVHIPLVNIPHADLSLRPELGPVLSRAGIDAGDLPTLDAVVGPDASAPLSDAARWFLVDHNALTGPLARQGRADYVVGCIDHHADEGVALPDLRGVAGGFGDYAEGDRMRVVRPAGSCMSLVVEACRDAWESVPAARAGGGGGEEQSAAEVDADLALVALAPILADTSSLGAPDRTTDTDRWAVGYLEAIVARAQGRGQDKYDGYERGRFLGEINRIKEDISSLPLRDVLRKDYKQWDDGGLRLGVSAVVRTLDFVVGMHRGRGEESRGDDGETKQDDEVFLCAVTDWAAECRLDMASVMTLTTVDGAFSRELLLWGLTEVGVAAVKRFERDNREKFGLEPWGGGRLDDDTPEHHSYRRCWTQSNLAASRKQIAPALREAMRGEVTK